jgi:hypothetical protein
MNVLYAATLYFFLCLLLDLYGVAPIYKAYFIANLALWGDAGFVAFFFYFLLTLIGGVTLLLALRPGWCARALLETPELATFAAVILAATAVGNADIWRYQAFLLPVITILYAGYVRDHRPGTVVLSAALLFTLATQQPFTPMDMNRYFRDWFPVYLSRTNDATPAFWSMWKHYPVEDSAAKRDHSSQPPREVSN